VEVTVLPALVYVLALAAAVAAAVHLAGYLPLSARPGRYAAAGGILAIGLFGLAVAALAFAAIRLAWLRLDWSVAVILGGLAVLAGPLLWQVTLRGRTDAPVALVLLAIIGLAAAGLVVSLRP